MKETARAAPAPASANGREIGRSWLPPIPCAKTIRTPLVETLDGASPDLVGPPIGF
jgi:hypothetical protein